MIPRYRAWDKETKSMNGMAEIYRNRNQEIELHPRDENGKEIFEGDIIDSTDGFLTGVVKYRADLGMFVIELVEYNNFERLCNVANSRRIIGNIWEHPELAEVSS